MHKYDRMVKELSSKGATVAKCFGNSMIPIIKSGSYLTFVTEDDYGVGDIVFCKVKGRFIDAHKIIQKNQDKGWLIANNHGYQNGWTKTIYGRVLTAMPPDEISATFFEKND